MKFKYIKTKNSNLKIKVDAEDFEDLNKYRWTIIKTKASIYVVRYDYDKSKNEYLKHKLIYMHRYIMGLPAGQGRRSLVVNHINSNGLDNRKENLEIVTNSVNNKKAGEKRKKNNKFSN